MAEPGLSLSYFDLVRYMARQLGMGLTFSTGTVAITSGVITLSSGGTGFPSWMSSGTTTGTGRSVMVVDTGNIYAVDFRTSSTAATLVDTSVSGVSGKAYIVIQSTSNDDGRVEEMQKIQDIIDRAYRQFCYPLDPTANDGQHYHWTWLNDHATFNLSASDADLALPDNFGGFIEDSLVYSAGSGKGRIEVITDAELLSKRQANADEGKPEYVAFRETTFASATGRRFEALFDPTPDASYTVNYLYRVVPDKLSPTNLYPICGAMHAETLLACCQMLAEQDVDQEPGMYAARYPELLAASINTDQAAKRTWALE